MRDDEVLGRVRDERLSHADFLDGLDEHEWRVGSLCPGWTVHDGRDAAVERIAAR